MAKYFAIVANIDVYDDDTNYDLVYRIWDVQNQVMYNSSNTNNNTKLPAGKYELYARVTDSAGLEVEDDMIFYIIGDSNESWCDTHCVITRIESIEDDYDSGLQDELDTLYDILESEGTYYDDNSGGWFDSDGNEIEF